MQDPIVSIIIPTYNREKLIVKALESVFNQSFQDFEILIIDDASTDNTEQVIKSLNRDNLRYFKLDKNGGQCIARNFGIGKARGEYIAFLDSDDEWLPEKLKLQVACFRKGDEKLGSVYGYAYKVDVLNNEQSLTSEGFHRGDIYEKFLEGFCPPTPSLFMVRKEALIKVGGFDENLITFVDLDLWLRISNHYHFDYIEEPLIIKYEYIGDQYISNFDKRYRGFLLFSKKWNHVIKQHKGSSGLMDFNKRIVNTLVFQILEHPQKNIKKDIPKMFGLLIRIRSNKWRYYIKLALIMLLGTNIIDDIKKKFRKPANTASV